MLRLKNIVKNYKVADSYVKALRDVNLSFRKNEFVSILGPSGCGKTTLLNIVGGLDKYTSGDLFINGKSTKEFKDRDWDVYRNHRIGFIFQSYNLIPHQTVLGNVELALTIAGMSKAERVKKAKQALDKVGLKGEYNKRPNQLSGGQCQRVAIARALVNDPEILLADEPTGALDTQTSIQIMDLIKEIANERLVIMVTHNPELAEQYSNRIIKLLDGKVISDTNPFSEEEELEEVKQIEQEKLERLEKQNSKKKSTKEKAKMSFWTAFKLSFQNLFSKKARTILTSIAGAIGIIGVSLVLSISNGVRTYIKSMQDDMLSGNPVSISQTATDLGALMENSTMTEKVKALKEAGFVNVDSMIEYLISRSSTAENFMISNDITEDYVKFIEEMPKDNVASIFYDYGIDVTNNIYTDFNIGEGHEKQNLSISAIRTIYKSILEETEYKNYSGYITSLSETFMQAPNDEDYILSQYDVLEGKVATEANEIMIVVEKGSLMTDLLLTQLGYLTQDQFMNLIDKATDSENYKTSLEKGKFSYAELMGKSFTYYPNDSVYTETGVSLSPFAYNYQSKLLSNGYNFEIVGILEAKENVSYGCLTSGFFFTEDFAKKFIEDNKNSKISEFMKAKEDQSITSMKYQGIPTGITYTYSYHYNGEEKTATGYVGTANQLATMLGTIGMNMGESYSLSLQEVGGNTIPYQIKIYPNNFEEKDVVLEYLDKWNSEEDLVVGGKTVKASERNDITYTDNISIIISLVNTFIDIVTYALVGFTSLSLVVSSVMIAIITYVSVVERIKEIGVIRSLGGRKRDVASLFIAETFIIGLTSGLFGIGFTYLASFIANLAVSTTGVISAIAIFPWHNALIMVTVSIILTLISGLFPSMSAAKKDPVVALRTE